MITMKGIKKENVLTMLDALPDTGIHVIRQDTHEILYYNRYIKAISPGLELGKKCCDVWHKNCENCPLRKMENQDTFYMLLNYSQFGQMMDVTIGRSIWDDEIPVFVFTITPYRFSKEEEEGLEQIRTMYSQSMASVFNECVIVNLSRDYYVNCQKGFLWVEHPTWGSYSYVNEHYGKMLIHPEDLPVFQHFFSKEGLLKCFREGKKQIIKRVRRKMQDGTYHVVEFTATMVEEMGDDNYWGVLVFRDINEEYLQELQKNVEMEKLATAARVAYERLIAVNLTMNTYYMMENDRYFTQKGFPSGSFDSLVESEAATLAPEFREEYVRKFSRQSLLDTFAGGQNQVYMEMRQMGDDGQYHWNSTHVVQVKSPYTNDIIEITMAKNIDEERRCQEESLEKERKSKELLMEALQKAETANSAKSDFLSKMSHDIRTPMNAILGLSTLAQVHIENPSKIKKYLEQIEIAGMHLLELINEVLDVSKIESGRMQVEEVDFDLEELTQNVCSIIRPAFKNKNQCLKLELQPGMCKHLHGDSRKLRQILVNLLENASKYSSEGEEVRFAILEHTQDNASLGTYQFVIEDHGIGMKEEYMEHIFEPFSRAKESSSKISGTGLGLTIVYNIVNMLGGTIDIQSRYGEGSCFTVTLCFHRNQIDEEREQEVPPKDIEPVNTSMKVLLVEDNVINQQIAIEMLNLLGVEVELAENGKQAVEMIERKPMYYYQMVFMDIQMPVMNGYEATRRIRSMEKGTAECLPIIAMTADAFSEDIKKSRMAGMNEHLAKPISLENLQKVLHTCTCRENPICEVSEKCI